MTSFLTPSLNGRTLTVDAVMNAPTLIRDRIATISDDLLLLGKLFQAYGAQVQGGGLLYSSITAADYYAEEMGARTPGTEYSRLLGNEPAQNVAPVSDFGAWFEITDEQRIRNDISLFDHHVTQSANTIVRQLDTYAVACIEAVMADNPGQIVAGHPWDTLVTVGPLDALTPSTALPTADFAAGQQVADLQEVGTKFDILCCHPNEAASLRTAYRQFLGDALQSAGIELFVTPRIEPGNAYLAVKGNVGIVAFEEPLRVEPILQRERRTTRFQSYCVPAAGVDRPNNIVKLTGLHS